jgi:hypothetical protein
MSTYLYEDTTLNMAILNANGFIFPFPAGSLMVVIRADDSYVNFQGVYGNQPFRQNTNGHILPDFVPATDILKQNGDAYATAAEIMSAMKSYLAGSQSSGSQFETFEVEITRPANTTAYTAGDVVADVSAAFLPLLNVAKATGTGVKIIRCRIQTDDTGVAGKKFNLHLYKEAPTFIADNAAFAISYANATKRKGSIEILMGTGSKSTVGSNDYTTIIINPTARDIFYILESVDAFTPSANSTKFTICIDCELSN